MSLPYLMNIKLARGHHGCACAPSHAVVLPVCVLSWGDLREAKQQSFVKALPRLPLCGCVAGPINAVGYVSVRFQLRSCLNLLFGFLWQHWTTDYMGVREDHCVQALGRQQQFLRLEKAKGHARHASPMKSPKSAPLTKYVLILLYQTQGNVKNSIEVRPCLSESPFGRQAAPRPATPAELLGTQSPR